MNNWWLRIQETFDSMPGRQRALMALAGFLIVTLPLISYVIVPTLEENKSLTADNRRIESQIEQLKQLKQELQTQLDKDINAPVKAEIAQLEQRLARAKGGFSDNSVLLPVKQRKQFLHGVLRHSSELGMESLEAKEPTIVFETGSIKLYQHAVQAEFTGRFFAISAFVDTLQKEYPNVQWARFDYKVNNHPTATVTIVWYLLSTDKEFISA
ncbi:Type II secretory pathway component [Idiomarina ramblicola]|uniref:Type II secretory pathway component n=1 Tax=Idiomarina ramblicola TaxID=263724 RepID=A0A432Z236_9GAMM|nr:Type II secretory pathway component [Idiomarina ramblicola]RUO71958.1 Type II secretory pathway component [Idiomarina ramblicola]